MSHIPYSSRLEIKQDRDTKKLLPINKGDDLSCDIKNLPYFILHQQNAMFATEKMLLFKCGMSATNSVVRTPSTELVAVE
ncbi:hypothetical protein MNL02_08640 [Bartonella krasnovii]|uniref:hypothetical protein n=1 Tax=Bartonella krasnovii TaxID=2267275 RepID=UPI001F4CFFA0|nr:hypothetical protein [Bartonella krasnovii]UNF52095.1 hypothetical protein MNL02_08640 [Bartonella krasnovii]